MRISVIAAFFALLLGSGCMVGPTFEEPVVETNAYFRFDSAGLDSTANIAWWELFQDSLLRQLIDTALANNMMVKAAAARIEEARAYAGFSEADLYPRLDITALAARGDAQNGPINLGKETTNLGFAPTLSWDLGFWGEFRRANRAAQQQLLSAQYAQRTVMIDLISEVAASYFLLLGLDAQLQIARQTVAIRDSATSLIRSRFEHGIAAEIDLNQSEIQAAIALGSIPLFERQIGQTENALSILLGQPPFAMNRDSLNRQPVFPEIPAGIPSDLLARRPDIQDFYYNLATQHEAIGIAEAMRLPSISLTGLFGVASNDLSSLFSKDGVVWNVSGSLFGPLFNFGKNLRRVEMEEARYQQFFFEFQHRALIAFKEVDDALLAIQTYQAEVDARNLQLQAADNAAKLSRARYYGGQTSFLEVLESERQQFNAALEAARVYSEQLIAYVQLYKALGGGWISPEEKAAAGQ